MQIRRRTASIEFEARRTRREERGGDHRGLAAATFRAVPAGGIGLRFGDSGREP